MELQDAEAKIAELEEKVGLLEVFKEETRLKTHRGTMMAGMASEGHRVNKYEELLAKKDHEVTVLRKALFTEGDIAKKKKRRMFARRKLKELNGEKDTRPSPNTVGHLRALAASASPDDVGDGDYDPIMSWVFIFKRAKDRATVNQESVDGEEEPATDPTDVLSTEVSHECWMFCERAVASELVIEVTVPVDKKTIIVSLGASYDILVDEAQSISVPMRMQETKGTMSFHKDLTRYYSSNHGGLNEFKDGRWEARDPNQCLGENHWKSPPEMTEDENAKAAARAKKIFNSGVAQRLVMSRLRRVAGYDPDWMMSLADPTKAVRQIHKNFKKEVAITSATLREALVCIGAYRPGSHSIFGTVRGSHGDQRSPIDDFARMVDGQPNIILKPNDTEAEKRYLARGHKLKNYVRFEMVQDLVRLMQEWQEGMGREEKWINTLKTFFPLHTDSELQYLKEQWGSPKLLLQCQISGYNPEYEPKILNPANPDEQRPAEIELNTFGSAGNRRVEHGFPLNLTYQPLEEIRDYFGDTIGLYFSWLGTYTRALFAFSLLGNVVMAAQPMFGGLTNNPLTLAYSIYTGLWSISFIEAWHRRENELRFLCKRARFGLLLSCILTLLR